MAPKTSALMPLLVGSSIVGVIVAASVPLEHHAAAIIRNEPATEMELDWRTVLTQSITHSRAEAAREGVRLAWADRPVEDGIRAYLVGSNRRGLMRYATTLTQTYVSAIGRAAQNRRTSPAAREVDLSDQLSTTRSRIAQAQTRLDAEIAALPTGDARLDREAWVTRWQSLRADWTASRDTLVQTQEELQRMRIQGEPTAGSIAAEDRRAAIDADEALQQDFKEVSVRWAELKLHLLTAWQQSAPRLEQLRQAVKEFNQWLETQKSAPSAGPTSESVTAMHKELADYSNVIETFFPAWTAEFTGLQQWEIDPLGQRPLEVFERSKTLLHDLLFAAGQRLSAMRAVQTSVTRDPAASSRRHVWESDLTRQFQVLQSAHHRFEFAAGLLETPENFRLDAALRAARGLRRRIQEQIQHIERRLDENAVTDARRQHTLAVQRAEHDVQRLRARSDTTVDELFTVQSNLWTAAELAQTYAVRVLRAELTAERIQDLQRDAANLEQTLADLRTQRLESADRLSAELLSCEIVTVNLRWTDRGLLGGLGLFASLGVMLGVRRWTLSAG